MGEVSLGNLYDINKNLMQNENALDKTEIKDKIRKMIDHYSDYNFNYFMLLCREQYNYTLFRVLNPNDLKNSNIKKDLFECLINRGEVLSIERAEGQAYEIWIKNIWTDEEDNIAAYYFFPYDNGVIET